jgi:hypothetical protein
MIAVLFARRFQQYSLCDVNLTILYSETAAEDISIVVAVEVDCSFRRFIAISDCCTS